MEGFVIPLLLALVQGIAEWFPVSSSGHLALIQHFLNYDSGLLFTIALHFGTLMAVFFYFSKDIVEIARELLSFRFTSPYGRLGLLVLVGSIPAAIMGFLLNSIIDSLSSISLLILGFFITSLLLFAGSLAPKRTRKKFGFLAAFLIGFAQVFSLFRGISRSGTTIVSGLFLGLTEKDAIRFSYLLSIPLIIGANVLTIGTQRLPPSLLWASLVSFGISLGVMHVSFKYVLSDRKNLRWIALYVLILAIVLTLWFLL